MHDLTHASFFSGVGGLDLGLERAGWRTVSFSEIDPYASAVLAERWPGVPNLGDITDLAEDERWRRAEEILAQPREFDSYSQHFTEWKWGGPVEADSGDVGSTDAGPEQSMGTDHRSGQSGVAWRNATLWSGGFPCQDLSVAGKRAGFAGERSSLAFAFLDLVERHRPPAILLENVPGLLSSNGGKDFGRLLGEVGNLGYWWAYRILDAQFFGVPQRRRRVFILALHPSAGFGPDSAAAVLSVGARCDGHSATRDEARPAASDGLAAGISRALSTSQERLDADTESFVVANAVTTEEGIRGPRGDGGDNLLVSPSPDPGGDGAPDGLAGRLDDREVVGTLTTPDTRHSIRDGKRQAGHLVSGQRGRGMERRRGEPDDMGLPLGLDSHRYRCCGNGVVSNVAEWIGTRLARAVALGAAA